MTLYFETGLAKHITILDGRKTISKVRMHLHGHGKCSFLRVFASKRHPCNVEWVGECPKGLGEDDAKVTWSLLVDFGEDSIEDVTQHMHTEASNGCVSTFIAVLSH